MKTWFKCVVSVLTLIAPIRIVAQDRAFTVRDSIEMNTFSDPYQGYPDAPAKCSPDHKYFAIVTTRGIINSDKVESMLRLYDINGVRACLRTRQQVAPKGRVLATLAAVPVIEVFNSYESTITAVRWTSDSRAILYLGLTTEGVRRLYRVSVPDGVSQVLTPAGYDVNDFNIVGDTIAYTASDIADNKEFVRRRSSGTSINANAEDVTGIPLPFILFPDLMSDFYKDLKLGVIKGTRAQFVTNRSSGKPLHISNARFNSVLAISPSGSKLVLLLPVKQVLQPWSLYHESSDVFQKAHLVSPDNADLTSDYSMLQLKQYSLVDLRSGKTSALVNAPFAWSLGYPDKAEAVWSPDEQKVLVSGTFLPLETASTEERVERHRPCSAAVIDVLSLETSCVVYSEFRSDVDNADNAKRSLSDAEFGVNNEEIKLDFQQWDTTANRILERYRLIEGKWKLVETSSHRPSVGETQGPGANTSIALSIWIKQALDEPPSLWARDVATGQSKELLNPNPQLANIKLGEATVYRWKDRTGYEWTGGLVKPVGYISGTRYPLVIQTYGFNSHQFLADGMDTTAEAAMPLASSGIAVLQIQKRSGYEITDQEAAVQLPGFEAAIDRLASEGLVDPKRVGIIGFSRGCYYVASALIKMPGRFAAATVADGADQSYMQHRMYDGLAQQDDSIYGVKPNGEGLKVWIKYAPGFNLDKVHTPLRIEAITPDSILNEWELYSSLREQGKPVDLIYFPDGQHILQRPLERLASQQGNVDWFRFWLQGYEDPDPAKVEQYARWRELRKLQEHSHNAPGQ